ncbi:hypothetical protein FTUN_5624 [Frigoriglobus tundricola]|uniref:Uncharacterized protein n=1 Tax=Frigoriglobus tundricola TaxID=2774151 RepID=A0A6M5YX53_9BACT|nr:hypothetical protein FTUN_5624 [Frigoriglobus tundricola]
MEHRPGTHPPALTGDGHRHFAARRNHDRPRISKPCNSQRRALVASPSGAHPDRRTHPAPKRPRPTFPSRSAAVGPIARGDRSARPGALEPDRQKYTNRQTSFNLNE